MTTAIIVAALIAAIAFFGMAIKMICDWNPAEGFDDDESTWGI